MRKSTLIFLLLTLAFSSLSARWGWGSHRFINAAAVDRLPPAMAFFQDHRDYLSTHSVDPDQNGGPGYYHYIDIDHYDAFFTGELPHTYDEMVAAYGLSTVNDVGVVPWVIEWWLEDLSSLMATGNWNDVWQVAAELGHYVGDSHQALHLTENYNGQMTGNYGIHSRYETELMNRHLDEITLPDSIAGYWDTPIDSIMAYIEEIYPVVALVLAADDQAYAVDPNHGNTYYNMMWTALGDTSIWTLNRAAVDVASLWYTAWINAGSPYPIGVAVDVPELPHNNLLQGFPNPFNGQLTLIYDLQVRERVDMRIFGLDGTLVQELASGVEVSGEHSLIWDGLDRQGRTVKSGVYLVQLQTESRTEMTKVTFIK